ncbi:hypothetical protein [Kribbella monticola]|uniref:hypothetical protein n=1 Tax=Kribbella monticola TaxID=2185285 RepID=UPI0013007C57|nr:hypothetical protein [Kribbella monticola]
MINDIDQRLPDQYRVRRAEQRAAAKRRTTTSIIVIVAISSLATALFWQVINRQPYEVAGIVRCLSGAPVQGIYVKEGRDIGSFADPERDPADPSVARFSSVIRGGQLWGVNIGCGPLNLKDWTQKPRSSYERYGYHEFACHDDPADSLYGSCTTLK